MKKILNHKKALIISMVIIAMLLCCSVVYAWELFPITPSVPVSDALKAGDVCEEHLLQHCTECEGYEVQANPACHQCGYTQTIACCNETKVVNDYREKCYMIAFHPKTCVNIKDLYSTVYFCPSCGGYATNGTHIESYYHTECSCADPCRDNTYCRYPRLQDLFAQYFGSQAADDEFERNTDTPDKPHDPVAAGDYCEIHDKFACDLDHFE